MKGWLAALLLGLTSLAASGQDAIFRDGFESPVVDEISCFTSDDPLNLPVGYRQYIQTWGKTFYNYTYPSSGFALAPVGSFSLRSGRGDNGPSIAGRYISTRIVPINGVYMFNWLQTQPIYENEYYQARVAKWVYVTISPCPGDFRLPNNLSEDPYLRTACRKISGSTSMYYSPTETGYNVCNTASGVEHYINWLFADPRDGLDPDEHSCLGGVDECEVNVRHEQQTQ